MSKFNYWKKFRGGTIECRKSNKKKDPNKVQTWRLYKGKSDKPPIIKVIL